MQAMASKRCEATVRGFSQQHTLLQGGPVANGAYGSLEIALPMNGNQSADVCLCPNLPMECVYWTYNGVSSLMSGYYVVVRDDKKL